MSKSAKLFLIAQMRRMLKLDVEFGNDTSRRDAVARIVFFHDCEQSCRNLLPLLPAPASSIAALLPAPRSADDARSDFAPSLDFLQRMKSAYSKYDSNRLDPDFQQELDWCDFWLDWHSRHGQ